MTPEDVTAILHEHLDAPLEAMTVTRGPAGNSQETWFVEARDGEGVRRELVVRRSAPAGVLDWTDRVGEHDTLRALGGRGLPVPEVYGVGTLERPYLLMERSPGQPPQRLAEDARATLARDLGGWLARLHALDLGRLGLAPTPTRDATAEQVRLWQARYRAARAAPVPLLGALLAWCERNVPDDGAAPVLLWGDPGPHNVLVEEGRVSALLDWELSHVGHPLEDLGALIWGCLGTLDPEAVLSAYEDEAGAVDRATLDYFVALACATRSVMMVNGVHAWVQGRAAAPSTAGLGLDLVALSLARGAAAAGWGELPPADGLAPELPLSPDAAESAAGVARWLSSDVLPATDDRRLRRQLKAAAALLEASAGRAAPATTRDLAAAEEAAVQAELAGGDPRLRATLLADLARERARLTPLAALFGHPHTPAQTGS